MNNLPNELLCHIFNHLPQKDLIKLTTVCTLFNEIIESCNLIKGIKIEPSHESSLPSPKRKYTKAFIRDNNATNYLKALQATGYHITEVTFDYYATTLSSIVAILNLLVNVKKIKFFYTSLEDDDETVDAVVHPLNGISLQVFESDPKIFKVLHQMSVDKLDLRAYGDSSYYNFTDFVPFMRVQKELKSFAMSGIYESNLMYGTIPKGDFHLSEFSISNCDLEEYVYLETFLADHVGSLEKLYINEVHSWDPTSIIKQCTKLKSLNLAEENQISAIDDDMTSVEELSFHLPNPNINKFPNVKKLYIQNAEAETNQSVSRHMSKVTDLCVRYGTVRGINLSDVVKMRLINIDELVEHEFFALHSKVENLSLENHFQLDDALLEVIVSNLSNLKVLKIHGLNNLTGRAFEILKNSCKNLKVLDTKSWTQHFNVNDWNCLYKSNEGIKIYTERFDF